MPREPPFVVSGRLRGCVSIYVHVVFYALDNVIKLPSPFKVQICCCYLQGLKHSKQAARMPDGDDRPDFSSKNQDPCPHVAEDVIMISARQLGNFYSLSSAKALVPASTDVSDYPGPTNSRQPAPRGHSAHVRAGREPYRTVLRARGQFPRPRDHVSLHPHLSRLSKY